VTELTEEQLKRIRKIRWAATGSNWENAKNLNKEDVRILAVRLEALELGDYACAEEQLRWLLERLKEDRKFQREWLADLIEQLRIAELQALEADEAVKAVEAMIAGGIHIHGEEVIKRWDAVEDDFRARGLLPPLPGPTPPQIEGVSLPAELVAQMPKAGRKAHAPAKPALPPAPAAEPPAPEALPPEPAPEPAPRMIGTLQTTQPGDPLTEKQSAVFKAILSAAGEDWRARISQGRMAQVSGVKSGGMWAHLEALEKKDYIRILDRGSSVAAGFYLICERARPERPVAPKTDAELIEEAFAAGKVTVCPPAHAH
jgi:hypothetical protein